MKVIQDPHYSSKKNAVIDFFSTDIATAATKTNVSQYAVGVDVEELETASGFAKEAEKWAKEAEASAGEAAASEAAVKSILVDIDIKHDDVLRWRNETEGFKNEAAQSVTEASEFADKAAASAVEAASVVDKVEASAAEAEAAATAAKVSETNAATSATAANKSAEDSSASADLSKEYADKSQEIYEAFAKGAVYRGGWNPMVTPAYPDPKDVNSYWDVWLNDGTTEFEWNSIIWRGGDRLIYSVPDAKYFHINTARGVTSVNGKVGTVVLEADDVDTYNKAYIDNIVVTAGDKVSKAGDTMTGALNITSGLPTPIVLNRTTVGATNCNIQYDVEGHDPIYAGTYGSGFGIGSAQDLVASANRWFAIGETAARFSRILKIDGFDGNGPSGWRRNIKLESADHQSIVGNKAGLGFHDLNDAIYFWTGSNNGAGGTYRGYFNSSGLKVNGSIIADSSVNASDFYLKGSDRQHISFYNTSGTATAYIWKDPETDYLTFTAKATHEKINIFKGRIATYSVGNDYNTGAVEVYGNGTANTVFPNIGFHQPGKYASSIQLRGAADFRFYAQGTSAYANITANAAGVSSHFAVGPVNSTGSNDFVRIAKPTGTSWGADKSAAMDIGGAPATGSTAAYAIRVRNTSGSRIFALEYLEQGGHTKMYVGGYAYDFTTSGQITCAKLNGIAVQVQVNSSTSTSYYPAIWSSGNSVYRTYGDRVKIRGSDGHIVMYHGYLGHSGLAFNNDGQVWPIGSDHRDAGMYGIYDSNRIGHIWSMGTSYKVHASGANFGNLYGFAYKHTNNTTGGTMAGGHQAVWCTNGVPQAALGDNGIWSSGTVVAVGSMIAKGVTLTGWKFVKSGTCNISLANNGAQGVYRAVIDTGYATSAWTHDPGRYRLILKTKSVTSGAPSSCFWGAYAQILPTTRWNGPHTVRAAVYSFGGSISAGTIYAWDLYEVTG